MAPGPRGAACARGPGRRGLLEGDLRTRQLSQGTDNKPQGRVVVLTAGGRRAGGRGGGRANVATDLTGRFGPPLGTKGPTGSSGLRTPWTGVTVHGAECHDRRHEMAETRGGRRRGGRGRTCPTRAPHGACPAGVPVVRMAGPATTSRLKSWSGDVDERDVGGARTSLLRPFGHTVTEDRSHILLEEEIDSSGRPCAPEHGRDLAERYLPHPAANSLDERAEQVYALRERMTLLQSRVELVHAELSSMRSGRASKDLYVRVFVPLTHELEETSLRYQALIAEDTRRRQRERPPAVAPRRHRRSTWLQLHRSVNLSG